jgi:hypothetical protein
VTELTWLKQEFRSLWLETNRSANLELLMNRYDRQIQYWEETIRALETEGRITDPLIESQWIYNPKAEPGRRDSNAVRVPKAYFRKIIALSQLPTSAKIQLIGDTHAQLWVNGVAVGEVYGRRSLSLVVEHERVKMWEIGSLLRPGENVIAVEVANYNQFGSAGVNIYAELKSVGGMQKIQTDSSWKVADAVSSDWKTLTTDNELWSSASSRTYPFQVIRPNFDGGRLSWIER